MALGVTSAQLAGVCPAACLASLTFHPSFAGLPQQGGAAEYLEPTGEVTHTARLLPAPRVVLPAPGILWHQQAQGSEVPKSLGPGGCLGFLCGCLAHTRMLGSSFPAGCG